MSKKTNLILLILCTILCQGIASLSDNINSDSLDLLVRRKRIIDTSSTRNRRPRLQDVPYAVQIRRNGYHTCGGSILSARVILTAAFCVRGVARYTVVASTLSMTGGSTHFVNGKLEHPNYVPHTSVNNIALLSILEPILLGMGHNHPIEIYQAQDPHLPPNTLVTTSGWGVILAPNRIIGTGFMGTRNERVSLPNELQSITVPTITLQECRTRHLLPWISNQHICTYHAQKGSYGGDIGNPLVFDGHLVGVLGWFEREHPDIYENVALPALRNWIISHMNHIPPLGPVPADAVPHHARPDGRPHHCSKTYPCND